MGYSGLSDVSSRYGAPMGRGETFPGEVKCRDCGREGPPSLFGLCGGCYGRNIVAARPDQPRRYYLRRVHLDSGGYDSGGAYWGHGAPLWHAAAAEGGGESFFRAKDRAAAKAAVRADFDAAAVFFR